MYTDTGSGRSRRSTRTIGFVRAKSGNGGYTQAEFSRFCVTAPHPDRPPRPQSPARLASFVQNLETEVTSKREFSRFCVTAAQRTGRRAPTLTRLASSVQNPKNGGYIQVFLKFCVTALTRTGPPRPPTRTIGFVCAESRKRRPHPGVLQILRHRPDLDRPPRPQPARLASFVQNPENGRHIRCSSDFASPPLTRTGRRAPNARTIGFVRAKSGNGGYIQAEFSRFCVTTTHPDRPRSILGFLDSRILRFRPPLASTPCKRLTSD